MKLLKFGNILTLRLSDSTEIPAEIVQIKEENNGRVIVFKITREVEKLIEYRKISFDIVWWSFTGWKISNSALIEENDLTYVRRIKAGVEDKVLVKVLRQNDTYSIVDNYTDEELRTTWIFIRGNSEFF